MPFDDPSRLFTRPRATWPGGRRAVAAWLFVLCGMILVMVTLGGATRLSGSGLSIMEWAPVMGTLPPLSEAEWQRLFGLYQQIPQFRLVNPGLGLEGFKGIFWLEWAHRFWGRLMGVAFAGPLVWFTLRRAIDGRLALRLGGVLLLGGLQGLVGWLMVASGFRADSVAVSAYRLVAHLGLALLLYAAILWTGLSLWRNGRAAERVPGLRAWTGLFCAVLALTMLAGGFVAGLRAGLIYNTFPLMEGRLVPEAYGELRPFWLNLAENIAAVQFNHRVLATLTLLLGLGLAATGLLRARGGLRTALLAAGGVVAAQYALGIATLLLVVPPVLGAAHQAMALLTLTAALVALHMQRGTPEAVRLP